MFGAVVAVGDGVAADRAAAIDADDDHETNSRCNVSTAAAAVSPEAAESGRLDPAPPMFGLRSALGLHGGSTFFSYSARQSIFSKKAWALIASASEPSSASGSGGVGGGREPRRCAGFRSSSPPMSDRAASESQVGRSRSPVRDVGAAGEPGGRRAAGGGAAAAGGGRGHLPRTICCTMRAMSPLLNGDWPVSIS